MHPQGAVRRASRGLTVPGACALRSDALVRGVFALMRGGVALLRCGMAAVANWAGVLSGGFAVGEGEVTVVYMSSTSLRVQGLEAQMPVARLVEESTRPVSHFCVSLTPAESASTSLETVSVSVGGT